MYTTKKGGMIMKLSNMSKMSGFTLAEVLITLGIIGVVAAMTMPTLINSTQGAQYKAAFKKALSAISQGVTLNVALDGSSFADAVAGTAGSKDKPAGGDSVASILNERMNIVRVETTSPYAEEGEDDNKTSTVLGKNGVITGADTFLYFNDGIMFGYKAADAVACTATDVGGATIKRCEGFIDVNGLKGPNKVTRCDTETETKKDAVDPDGSGEWIEAPSCEVTNPTDIYPVFFYDQTILPSTNAAKAVLYGK